MEPLPQVMSDENPPNSRRNARGKGKPVQVLSYRHGDTRVNNPEVGMVHIAVRSPYKPRIKAFC